MSETRERDAKAIKWIVFDDDTRLRVATAALLAALDPEDEAMRKAMLSAMGFYCEPGLKFSAPAHDQARAAISALRAMVLPNEKGIDRE